LISGLAHSRGSVFRSARPRCVICGTHLDREDALGLADAGPAHAECVLVRWLTHPQPPRGDSSTRSARIDLATFPTEFPGVPGAAADQELRVALQRLLDEAAELIP
jgi:hypothetical protein